MTKLLEQAIEQLRELPAEDQNAAAQALFVHMTSGNANYRLTPAQVREVKRIQRNLRTGKTRLATKREMAVGIYRLTEDERSGIRRGLKAMREGKFASEKRIVGIFRRARAPRA